jgi:hypothetical protein
MALPTVMPTATYGVRHLLEAAVRRTSLKLQPVVASDSFEFLRHHALAENILGFQIPIGLPTNFQSGNLVSRPLDERDVPPGVLYFGQLRRRTLRWRRRDSPTRCWRPSPSGSTAPDDRLHRNLDCCRSLERAPRGWSQFLTRS